jgi:hypothetical protein
MGGLPEAFGSNAKVKYCTMFMLFGIEFGTITLLYLIAVSAIP